MEPGPPAYHSVDAVSPSARAAKTRGAHAKNVKGGQKREELANHCDSLGRMGKTTAAFPQQEQRMLTCLSQRAYLTRLRQSGTIDVSAILAFASNSSFDKRRIYGLSPGREDYRKWPAQDVVRLYARQQIRPHFDEQVNGKYCMYFLGDAEGQDTQMGLAYPDDLRQWTEALDRQVLSSRPGMFDSQVVEQRAGAEAGGWAARGRGAANQRRKPRACESKVSQIILSFLLPYFIASLLPELLAR